MFEEFSFNGVLEYSYDNNPFLKYEYMLKNIIKNDFFQSLHLIYWPHHDLYQLGNDSLTKNEILTH